MSFFNNTQNNASTPSGSTPAGGLFGGVAPGSAPSLFGNAAQTNATTPGTNAPSLFGNPSATSGAGLLGSARESFV
jgi:hypothetical protein